MLIKVENVSYIYGQNGPFEKKALDNVSLSISEGEFIGIIGHTGSGKSTLLQLLNALLKPTSGKVLIDGHDTKDKASDLRKLRSKVGLVFQYPEHQLFEETVYADIAFAPKNLGLTSAEINDRVFEAAALTGLLEETLNKSPFELSGGQKRRAAIAGVLAMKPRCLILDEPTAGLDPKGRADIMSSIVRLQKQTGIAVVFVSHNMEEIAECCDSVYVMNSGKFAMQGDVREVFTRHKELREINLSAPQISVFMRGLCNVNVKTVYEAKEYIESCLKT